MGEEGVVRPDVPHGELVGVRENKGRHSACAKLAVQVDHGMNRREDVAEDVGELAKPARVAGEGRHLGEELLIGHLPALQSKQQRGLVQQPANLLRIPAAVRRQAARHDAVVEFQQHFPEVEDNGGRSRRGGGVHGQCSGVGEIGSQCSVISACEAERGR